MRFWHDIDVGDLRTSHGPGRQLVTSIWEEHYEKSLDMTRIENTARHLPSRKTRVDVCGTISATVP